MNILRKAATATAATLLVLVLLSFGLAWSVHQVIGSAGDVKKALRTSGIYQSVVSQALDQAQKDEHKDTSTTTNDIPVSNPQIRTIIESAFPPAFLQTQTEGVIDSAYAWIQGNTSSLQFKIDLTSAKTRLADGVGQYVQTHLASLPACTAANLPTGGDVDPFNATCVPAGFDIQAAVTKSRDNILHGDFLKDTVITADTIKDKNGKTLNEQVKQAPDAYHKGILATYGSAFLAVALAAAVLFGSRDWRRGLRRVGVILVTIGALSALFGWMSSFTVHKAAAKIANTQTSDAPLQAQLIKIVQSLADDLRTWWMAYGITLIVLGIIAIVVSVVLMRRKPEVDTAPRISIAGSSDDLVPDAEPATAAQPVEHVPTAPPLPAKKPASKPRPRKVQ
ncbi:MAG TPA: hypothetical protein VLI54_02605 [Bacillota bacterium]|nr:hypothetical protein [Bacillota bacterium]